MAKQTINVGLTANDKRGDPLRTAFTKINQNFTELYNVDANTVIISDISDLTDNSNLLFSGNYEDLANTPFIPSDITDLTDNSNLLFSGNYDDLENKPSIPTDLSDLTDTQNLLNPPLTTFTNIVLTNSAFIIVPGENFFEKEDYATGDSAIDTFVLEGEYGGVGITRGDTGGIYDPYREESFDENLSPDGILWNLEGWDDLSNIQTRTFIPFYQAYESNLDNNVPGSKALMHIPDYGKYYAIEWLSWTPNNNGGGFSYNRYEIDENQIQEGVRFADGTILKTAAGLGRIKLSSSGSRRIEEVYGYKEVAVTAVSTINLTTFASRTVVDSSQIFISTTANTTIDEIISDPSVYGILNFSTIQFSIDNSTWYTWGGGIPYSGEGEESYNLEGNPSLSYNEGDVIYFRYDSGGAPAVWWNKNDLPAGGNDFRGAVIDYHAYSGEATWIGTIHIVDDSGDEHITHTEVMSGSTDGENDDLWLVQNEGTISYRRIDKEAKTLKVHWTAKVFYGTEYYDD